MGAGVRASFDDLILGHEKDAAFTLLTLVGLAVKVGPAVLVENLTLEIFVGLAVTVGPGVHSCPVSEVVTHVDDFAADFKSRRFLREEASVPLDPSVKAFLISSPGAKRTGGHVGLIVVVGA